MQTFKTAVVVVLLLTVMYGAYVSLTTPPPDNIDGLDGLITELDGMDEGDLGIDDGTGASFGISDDEITSDSFEMPDTNEDVESETERGAVGSLSDAWEEMPGDLRPPSSSSDAPEEDTVADESTRSRSTPRSLPKPTAGSPDVQLDPAHQYASTDQGSFSLPDPSSLPTDLSMAKSADESSTDDDEASAEASDSDASRSRSAATQASRDATDKPTERKSRNSGLSNAISAADRLVENDQMKEALATLSVFYDSPDLTDEEREQLLERLDPLAGEVIYSRRHLLEQPHRVGQNETLMEIAAKYDTPWQLLANINGIEDPVIVLPGTELKVVRGPFRAEINLARSELTIFLDESYAGRFPIVLGSDPAPQPGSYTVQDKQTAKTYYDATGTPIPPGDARNPFGDVWLDLGKQMCIHGSSEDESTAGKGCISLKPAHAQDIYGILTHGASVTVRR